MSKKKTIYYDGSCDVCSNIMLRVGHSTAGTKFAKVDLVSDSIPKDLTREQLAKEIHVIDQDGVTHRNFAAILNILEEYPKFKWLVFLGKLPVFQQIGEICYMLFAANRHYIFGALSRIFWTKVIVSLGFLSAILITTKLWMTDRSFPLVPIIPGFTIPAALDYIVYAALLILPIAIIFTPKPSKLIFYFSGLFALLVFFDITRLQIFYYQYVCMFLALGLFSWDLKNTSKASVILNTCRLLVACVYFWGGIQKMNLSFALGVFPWFIEPITNLLPEQLRYYANFSGFLIPFFEMGIGIALLNKWTRPFAVLGATAMHCFILFSLGPLGHNWAPAVWPWNVVMIMLLFVLFWKSDVSFKQIVWVKNFAYHKLVLLLFAIMPFFSFFNAWPSYLSFTMYSGNLNNASIYLENNAEQSLPQQLTYSVSKDAKGKTVFDIADWAHREMYVLAYPETYVFKAIGKNACKYIKQKDDAHLVITGKPTVFNADKQTSYSCADL